MNITISNDAQAGNYSIFPLVFSQYYSQTISTLVHSGASDSTEYSYKIWNNSEFPDDFYEEDYNYSEWDVGAAPFGNEELRGIDPNSIWTTDDENYTHISARHWFNYSESLDFSELRVKIAHDNYYRAYLNGYLIRDCFSGWGCYGNGDYWEDTININNSWLNEGENLFAIAARDNTQGWGGGGGGSAGVGSSAHWRPAGPARAAGRAARPGAPRRVLGINSRGVCPPTRFILLISIAGTTFCL